MGMYTELHFNAELENATDDVIEVLSYMLDNNLPKPEKLPGHALFKTQRWSYMLRCDSYYFAADTCSTIRKERDTIYLCIRCNLKNYDNEIQKFCDWINPYISGCVGSFLGFYRYEEKNEPTLIYKK